MEDKYEVSSHFKPKVCEPFYNHSTHTLTIILHCKVDENLTVGDYKFQELFGNVLDEKGLYQDRMSTVVSQSREIIDEFNKNALNVKVDAVQRVVEEIELLRGKDKAKFYFEMIENGLPEAQEEYKRRTESVADK